MSYNDYLISTSGVPYFDPILGATGSIVWEIGYMPLPSDPEDLLGDISFKFKASEDCAVLTNPNCYPKISLVGSTEGVGETSGTAFEESFIQGFETSGDCAGEPIPVPLIVDFDTDKIVQSCGIDNSIYTREFYFCNREGVPVSVSEVEAHFPQGSRFYNEHPIDDQSIEYTVSNPFPANSGTSTYYAVPPGITQCYFAFDITIDEITGSPTVTDVAYCLNETSEALNATPSNPAYTLYFYEDNNSLTLPETSITPSTNSVGSKIYYVSQGLSNTCISSTKEPLIVTVTAPPVISLDTKNNPTCFGGSNGTIDILISGGVTPYRFDWTTIDGTIPSGQENQQNLSGLKTGTYTVTITDDNECISTESFTINEPNVLAASAVENSPVVCNGENNGSATVTVTGGNAPYSYAWDNSASTSATANDLVAGLHTITITDNKGCQTTATVTINQPDVLAASAVENSPVVCNGENNGSATVTVTGGNAPYSYSWDNSTSIRLQQTTLLQGYHTITITDNKGCQTTATVTINQPDVLAASAVENSPVVCNGENNGSATVTVTGGNTPYS